MYFYKNGRWKVPSSRNCPQEINAINFGSNFQQRSGISTFREGQNGNQRISTRRSVSFFTGLFTAALALRSRGLVIAWSVFVVVVVVVV